MKQIARILTVIIVGLCISYYEISALDHIGFFVEIENIILGIASLFVFITVAYFDKLQFRRTKKWYSFIATLCGLFILSGYFFVIQYLKKKDSSPSQIYCVSKMMDFNGISIDFRKDGTYKLTSWSIGADIYRGNFTLKDSIITIDKSKIENAIVSNRFVIRQDGDIDSKGEKKKSIYQIDLQGRIISGSEEFRVIDNSLK